MEGAEGGALGPAGAAALVLAALAALAFAFAALISTPRGKGAPPRLPCLPVIGGPVKFVTQVRGARNGGEGGREGHPIPRGILASPTAPPLRPSLLS